MRLLERDTQVGALLGYAADAAAGTGRLALVEGEAGVGKSTLVEQLEPLVPQSRWLWGACDGLATPAPLMPLRDIAGQVGGALQRTLREDAPRAEVFDAFLDVLAEDGGCVAVIEDVHWADDATLDLLRFVGRRVQRLPVLLLVTLRDEHGSPALRTTLGELARQRAVRRVSLPRLSLEATSSLVQGTGLDATDVHRLTGGNPFFVAEVVRAPAGALPASVRDSVLGRLAALPGEAREVAEVAALAGPRAGRDLVDALVADAAPGWDALAAAGLVEVTATGFRFRHEIARLAVAEALPPRRAAEVHARLLAALDAGGETDAARLAFHAVGAGDAAAVLEHAPQAAADAEAMSAHREAAAHLRQALDFSDGATDAVRARLHDGLAHQLSTYDDWEAAAVHLKAALALWRASGDRLREGDTLRRLSRAEWRLSHGAESERLAVEAVEVLEDCGSTPELARSLTDLAGTHMVLDRNETARELALRAIDLGERLGLPDVLSDALNTVGCTESATNGHWEDPLRRALDVALAARLPQQAARAYVNLYSGYVDHVRISEGERTYLDGVAYCLEHDASTFGNCMQASRAEALEATGRWDEALELARGYLREATMSPINGLHFMLPVSRISLRRGADEAPALIEDALSLARGTGEPQWVVPLLLARAERRWLDDRADDARADVAEALGLTGRSGSHFSPVAAWAARLDLTAPGDDVPAPWSWTVRGDHAAAARAWEELDHPYDAALALLDGDDPDGWREAFARFDRLGARPAAAQARRRLREVGAPTLPHAVRSATREHPAGLTAREQEVLTLLCTGATNEQIAGDLVISPRTAAHHVSAVLAKLGVSRRGDAVVEARARGWAAPHGQVLSTTWAAAPDPDAATAS